MTIRLAAAFLIFGGFAGVASPALTTLYTFTGGSDGGSPLSSLLIGKGGVLYGTTHFGGAGGCSTGCGTVYSVNPPTSPGGLWVESVIHSFMNSPGDGASPYAGVIAGTGGVLYGTTYDGGTWNEGTVYSLTPPPSSGGAWTEGVLYSFAGAANGDGSYPEGGVVAGKGGVLYGVTYYGGSGACPNGCGTVYSLTPPSSPGGAWTETVLHDFAGAPTEGANPAGVAIGAAGVLYGSTSAGGTYGSGAVFSLTPPASPGGAWSESLLYSFQNGSDGGTPQGGVVVGTGGVLYGTTFFGGTGGCTGDGCGAVFSLTPPAGGAGGAWSQSVVHGFAGGSDGIYPTAGLAIGSGGILYGTTRAGGTGEVCFDGCGTVFSLTPPPVAGGVWTESVLYNFGGGKRGSNPSATVTIGAGGVIYGTTGAGGAKGSGTVFKLKP